MDDNSTDIEAITNDLKQAADDLKVDTFLSLLRTAEVVNKYLDFELSKYGASRARSATLNALITYGGSMRPTDLSRKLFRSKHSITKIVDSLEKEGLVIRKPIDEDDRRIRRVAITKRGLEYVKTSVFRRRDISYKALSWLDNKHDTQELNRILRQLRRHLLKHINNPQI